MHECVVDDFHLVKYRFSVSAQFHQCSMNLLAVLISLSTVYYRFVCFHVACGHNLFCVLFCVDKC